jgi:hypothetical protein
MTHPIRKAQIHTFQRNNPNGKGREWIAQFYPYKIYPVFFSGPTEAVVLGLAEDMRKEAIDKYEHACIKRIEATAKRKEQRDSALAQKRGEA